MYCGHPKSHQIDIAELLDFFVELIDIFEEDKSSEFTLSQILQNDWNLFSSQNIAHSILLDAYSLMPNDLKNPDTTVTYLQEIEDCVSYWEVLKHELKWERRFLINLDTISFDYGWDRFFEAQTGLSDKTILYRARIHHKEGASVYSINEMGSPPAKYSTNGRANPEGISFLYLCKEWTTTLYETRVTYLDELSIGKFSLKKNETIKLVDFTSYGSPFLEQDKIEYAKSRFLKKKISLDLSKPVRRYDSQIEYIPTQFICEFIKYITGAHGIIFESSVHKNGVNYVIFADDKLECLEVNKYQVDLVEIKATLL